METVSGLHGRGSSYLRDVQYATPDNLAARSRLHQRYSTAKTPWLEWVRGHLAWSDGVRGLEIGCGPGWLWEDVELPPGASLVLSDLSLGMVVDAIARVGTRDSAVSHAVAAVEALPFSDDAFDLVIANHMLYHADDPDLAVREITRVLAPGGRLVAATNGPDHLRELDQIRAEVFGPSRRRASERFERRTGSTVLSRHLADVEWIRYDDELRCTDLDDVLAYLTSVPPGSDASHQDISRLRIGLEEVFDRAGRQFRVTKDTGVFTARSPG